MTLELWNATSHTEMDNNGIKSQKNKYQEESCYKIGNHYNYDKSKA